MLPKVNLIRGDRFDWVLMNTEDTVSTHLRKHGEWGRRERVIAQVFLHGRKNADVIDAGANLGAFAVPVANVIAANGGRVHAFEPQRIVYQQLCANVFLNRLDNVMAYNLALGAEPKTLSLPGIDYSKSRNCGGFSLDDGIRASLAQLSGGEHGVVFQDDAQRSETIRQERLDDVAVFDRIALIKADIEGNELELFKGAQATIKRNLYPPILFELWQGQEWYQDKAERTKAALTDLGYQLEMMGSLVLAQHPDHPYQGATTSNGQATHFRLTKTPAGEG